jgi:hypothetical protein
MPEDTPPILGVWDRLGTPPTAGRRELREGAREMAKKTGIQIEIDKINTEIEELIRLRNRLETVQGTQRRQRVKKTVQRQESSAMPRELAIQR